MKSNQVLLALGHQARVGKDTFAEYISYLYPTSVFSFAEDVYKITNIMQILLGRQPEKDRELLQCIGTGFRDYYGENIWVDRTIEKINICRRENPYNYIIVTDVRFPNEKTALEKNGFITVKITKNNRETDNAMHISEIALVESDFDFTIKNDGTIEDFHNSIDDLIRQIIAANC